MLYNYFNNYIIFFLTRRYIEIAWAFSTLIGLVLFLVEIAILCWVKFYDLSPAAAWSACIVLIPVLIIFIGMQSKNILKKTNLKN